MRGHMPAVRQQRHGVEPVTGDDLHQHGQAGQNDHRPGLTLGAALQRTVVVRWLPLRMIAARHTNSFIDAFQLVPCHAGKVNRCLWPRSEEHTSELQSLMRLSSAVFCLKKNKSTTT